MKDQKHYYHLIAGNVVYKVSGDTEANPMGVITLNGLITTKANHITLADMGRAQQVLQMHFRNKTQDPEIEIVDVVTLNIVPLGQFTTEEFHNTQTEEPSE